MALPPIIANSPVGKLLGTDQAKSTESPKEQASENTQSSSSPRDVVEISDAAQAKLKEADELNEAQARETAAETRDQLAKNENLTLGREEQAAG